eukprot:1159209-Pelagomonas_calceolata.AAC.7
MLVLVPTFAHPLRAGLLIKSCIHNSSSNQYMMKTMHAGPSGPMPTFAPPLRAGLLIKHSIHNGSMRNDSGSTSLLAAARAAALIIRNSFSVALSCVCVVGCGAKAENVDTDADIDCDVQTPALTGSFSILVFSASSFV